ncbi:limbic system-associated membrane protein [Halyomorpha halys]|uniref:limbic system-associated membrane protein n=1 Tax=Halyomorpha halys TaxID=286706 RepID=UPI0006D5259E|nr:neural cell adhesion molecule 2 [Halyomorpha halys]
MFPYEVKLVLIVGILGFCNGALQLSPALNEAERYVNDSYMVTCFGGNGTGAKWFGPENLPIPVGAGRIHTEERNNYVSLIFEYILRNDSGSYICSKDNEKVSFKLTVVKPIKFLPGLEEQHIAVGSSDQVMCEAEGIPQPTFMWHVNGSLAKDRRYTPLPTSLHIMNVTRNDSGTYLCRAFQVTAQTSIVMDLIINVSVYYKPTWKHWQDWFGYMGGTANLTCEVEAEPPAEFAWTHNNQSIEAARIITEPNRSVLQINVTDESVFGTYECKAWNDLGSIKKTGELVEGVKPDPPTSVSIDSSINGVVKLVVKWDNNDENRLGARVEYQESSKHPVSWENSSFVDFVETDGPYVLNFLKSNKNYVLRVATMGEAGLSDFTEDLTLATSAGAQVSHSQILTSVFVLLSILNYFVCA